MVTNTISVILTAQELTMIRVACIQRLERLKDREDCKSSYEVTRALLLDPDGALYCAAIDAGLLARRVP